MRRFALAALALVLACSPTVPRVADPPPSAPEPIGGSTRHVSATEDEVTEADGTMFRIHQGRRGDPAALGCADGQREGFLDDAQFPTVAGCLGVWPGTVSLRATATGQACGDDGATCTSPADLCATGWHVCGGAAGGLAEIRRVTAEQCENAGGGRYSFASSHCKTNEGCVYASGPQDQAYPCMADGWCSESICCGAGCPSFGDCPDGGWPAKTHIAIGTDQGCGRTSARRAGGVICCK